MGVRNRKKLKKSQKINSQDSPPGPPLLFYYDEADEANTRSIPRANIDDQIHQDDLLLRQFIESDSDRTDTDAQKYGSLVPVTVKTVRMVVVGASIMVLLLILCLNGINVMSPGQIYQYFWDTVFTNTSTTTITSGSGISEVATAANTGSQQQTFYQYEHTAAMSGAGTGLLAELDSYTCNSESDDAVVCHVVIPENTVATAAAKTQDSHLSVVAVEESDADSPVLRFKTKSLFSFANEL